MRKLILLATVTALCFGAYAANGFCQAAAEYSATTSGVASAAASAGSTLGAATNNAAGDASLRVAQRSKFVRQARRPGNGAGRGGVVRPLGANAHAQALRYGRQTRIISNPGETAPAAREIRAVLPPCASSPATGSPAQSSPESKAAGVKATPACKPDLEVAYPSSLKLSFPDK
ncbi:MAG TPA: hypothetical protein VGZ29_10260 [Terriglobia bacterium]|nr:hypothetical protein [Terriglobia bacterium]